MNLQEGAQHVLLKEHAPTLVLPRSPSTVHLDLHCACLQHRHAMLKKTSPLLRPATHLCVIGPFVLFGRRENTTEEEHTTKDQEGNHNPSNDHHCI